MTYPSDESAIKANHRWSDEQGRTLTCGGCGQKWKEECWRENDGPCKDGKFYCLACLVEGPCGCGERPMICARASPARKA